MAETQTRKLAAILAADIAGYSVLMGADEDRTVSDLKGHQAVLLPMVTRAGGRVIDTAGDGILAEFPSVLNAVNCAVAIQKTMAERNALVDLPRRMQFRIGINQGDVVVDDARVYGDGVNIAARLEGIAEAGGICISAKVHAEISRKIDLTYRDLGLQQLKNITHPVHVYRVELRHDLGISQDVLLPQEKTALALPDRPSIAVLPFVNRSDDADQEYFSDGITEDIITELSRFSELFVIARNSSFQYKARSLDVRQVGRELGVRYVLEGSIRRSGDRVRISGQLVDATTGAHRWAERYEGNLSDIFALQDELTASVVGAVIPSLQSAEIERARRKPPDSLDAYDLYLRALPEFYSQTQRSNQQALQLVEKALELDPNFVAAVILAENCWSLQAAQGWRSASEAHPEVMRYARRAVQIDKDNAEALATLARRICLIEHDYEEAILLAQRAVELNPNSAIAWRQGGYALVYCGRAQDALKYLERAVRLSPRDPRAEDCWTGMTLALIQLERDQEAVTAGRKAVQGNPNSASAWRAVAAALALVGQIDDARSATRRLLAIDPDCTLTAMERRYGYTEKARARYFDGMRKAGLREM